MTTITGVILAGGRARRMGGTDKGLVRIAGMPMAAHVLRRLEPQVGRVLINANRNLDSYRALGVPVVPDFDADFAGPLAGMAAGMHAAGEGWIVTVPCDSPLVPADLVLRLIRARDAGDAELAVASGAGRLQPVFALLPCSLASSLRRFLDSGERKIDRWYALHRLAVADFEDIPETFLNINTPEERDAMEAHYFGGPAEAGSDE